MDDTPMRKNMVHDNRLPSFSYDELFRRSPVSVQRNVSVMTKQTTLLVKQNHVHADRSREVVFALAYAWQKAREKRIVAETSSSPSYCKRSTIMATEYATDALFLPEMMENSEELHEAQQDEWNASFPQAGYQPIIGIPLPVKQGNQGPLFIADAVSAWAVERMRGRIFLIPLWPFPTHKHLYQSLWQLVQSMDGLVLPAGIQGTDWHSLWKERAQEPGPERWSLAWEMALAQLATYMGMPILAIGDGAEKWNSALGGKRGEMQRDDGQMAPTTPDTWDRHTIRVRAHSALASVLQPALALQDGEYKPWDLAFLPHQSVEQIAPGLRSCAVSEDGAIVAFERRDEAFGLGIIGRLDWGLDQVYGTTLFDAFFNACQSFDATRQQQRGWESARDTICATVYNLVTQGHALIPLPQQASQEEKYPRSHAHSTS